jgi:hypothetical protein
VFVLPRNRKRLLAIENWWFRSSGTGAVGLFGSGAGVWWSLNSSDRTGANRFSNVASVFAVQFIDIAESVRFSRISNRLSDINSLVTENRVYIVESVIYCAWNGGPSPTDPQLPAQTPTIPVARAIDECRPNSTHGFQTRIATTSRRIRGGMSWQ